MNNRTRDGENCAEASVIVWPLKLRDITKYGHVRDGVGGGETQRQLNEEQHEG